MQCLIITNSNELQKINDLLADGWRVVHEPPPSITLLPPRVLPMSSVMYAEEFEPSPPIYLLMVVLEKPKPTDH